jgi:methyl-accepting chemotaxis protein
MSGQTQELHQRNKLMVGLLWGCLALGIGACLDSPPILFALSLYGILIALLCTVLTWRRIGIPYIMYVIAVGMNAITFFFISGTDKYSNTLIIYVCLGIVSIYHNYRPLLVNGVISIGIVNYFLETKEAFADVDKVGANVFLILLLAALVAQSRIGSRMMARVEAGIHESEQARSRIETILREVSSSAKTLSESAVSLQGNNASAGKISDEIAVAFHEIAKGTEAQASSTTDISEAIRNISDTVTVATDASIHMTEKLQNTARITLQGYEHMGELSKRMADIHEIVASTTKVMAQMTEENEKIGSILSVISDIANQTNLLALNASIEAARAGEQGRGFAVVATEIRKLSQHVQAASEEISENLGSIQTKVKYAAGMVQEGLETVVSGTNSAAEAERMFADIKSNSEEIAQQAENLRLMNEHLLQESQKVAQEMASVVAVTEQSAASIEEVLASVDEQAGRGRSIAGDIARLHQLTKQLDELVK